MAEFDSSVPSYCNVEGWFDFTALGFYSSGIFGGNAVKSYSRFIEHESHSVSTRHIGQKSKYHILFLVVYIH